MKWGVIGAGKISTQFAEDGSVLPNREIIAVATTKMETAEPFAEKFGIPNAYSNWKKLLEHDDIANIYVGSPHTMHKDMVIECLKAGKNVLCEKPLGVNYKEAKAMIDASEKYGKLLMEAMWTVFFPTTQKIKDFIETNKYGKLHTISTNKGYGGTKTRDRWRYYNHMAGGGLLDLGVYPIHVMRYLFGKMPNRHASFAKLENDVDVYSSILMDFDGVLCTCTQTSYNDVDNFATFYFDKAVVTLTNRWYCTDTIIIDEAGKDRIVLTFPFEHQGMQYEIAAFEEAAKQNKTEHTLITHKSTLEVVQMMDNLRKEWGLVYPQDK